MRTTRREIIAAAATLAARNVFARASQPATAVNFAVPANACDTHTHIFGEASKFPFFSGRVYTPEPALPAEMSALHKALHLDRVVLVNPSVYGTDNSATLYGIKARGNTARGVAVIDDKTTEAELDALHAGGIRGIRINLATVNQADPAIGRKRLQSAIDRVKKRKWHIQMYVAPNIVTGVKDIVLASSVPVVFDHFGGIETVHGMNQPGFADLVELVHSGRAYVKISGAYRASTKAPDFADVTPFAKALIQANPDRIVWGTDWPHPNSAPQGGRNPNGFDPLYQVDDGRLFNQLPVWAPDAGVRKKILVDNPARLYDWKS